jgi:subtilase family serine protease
MRMKRKAACIASAGAVLAAVGGLASLSAPRPAGDTAPAGPAVLRATVTVQPAIQHVGRVQGKPPTTASCEATMHVACYEPAQLQQAYNLQPLYRRGVNGQGTTIVIVDSFGAPMIRQDLKTFDTTFRLPAPPSFQIIQPSGAVPKFNPASTDMLSWAGETSLDVEYAHTIAPDASILLVETPVAETEGVAGFPQIVQAEKYVISHYHADVISQSFSATEETFPSKASVEALRGAYLDANQHHVTVLAASGDSGAAGVGLDQSTYYLSPVTGWPPSDPLVTGVGGTQLHLDASGNRTSPDTAWNDTYGAAANQFLSGGTGPSPLASGGGKSVLFQRPFYQDGVRNEVGSARGVPDISMSGACSGAVDVYTSLPGGTGTWSPTCGTSEATPLFAGIVALAAQEAHHPLGLINPALYLMSARHLPGIVDVTAGNNTVSFTQKGKLHTVQGFSARAGYSTVAGVGTVNGALFVGELARLARS